MGNTVLDSTINEHGIRVGLNRVIYVTELPIVINKVKRKYAEQRLLGLDIHWLPVVIRMQYKVLVTVFKSYHSGTPQYLADLITQEAQSCQKTKV